MRLTVWSSREAALRSTKCAPTSLPGKAKERGLAFGSSAASLHTKAIVFDRTTAFVGSMNLDPRSQRWNTEIGILVQSPELAQQVLAIDRIGMEPGNTYRVVYEAQEKKAGRLVWITGENGQEKRLTTEPASIWRRMEAGTMGWVLPQDLL